MSGGKKPPTAAELNARSRERWGKWSAQIRSFEQRHPERAGKVAERAGRLVHQGHISNPELANETSYSGAIIESVELLAAEQSIRARKPRVRKSVGCRQGILAAMRVCKLEHSSFVDFVEAAKNSSIPGVHFELLASSSKNEYRVNWESADEEIVVSLGTLRNWWTAAGKSTPN